MSIIGLVIVFQLVESFSWFAIKWSIDPRVASSKWIVTHIRKGSQIGLENVPIYQMIPDVLLKDYYTSVFIPKARTLYSYEIVDKSTRNLPQFVIITGEAFDTKYLNQSPKKDLLVRLKKERYKQIIYFPLNLQHYLIFNTELNYYLSGLVAAEPIAVYEKR